MRSGNLNKKIVFLEKNNTKDDYGYKSKEWVDTDIKVWANIKPLQGRELYQAKQVQAEIELKVTIRYRSGITSNMGIRYGERILEILAPPINVEEKNRFLEIMCKEVV